MEALGALDVAWREHVADEHERFDRLVARHGEPQRHYHRIEHVAAVVRDVIELAEDEALPYAELDLVVAAAMFHDAVYDPTASANEVRSADLARSELSALGWSTADIERVAALIVGTATHHDPVDLATAVLFDADLAILGTTPDGYEHYRSAVRLEYSHVADADWRRGRTAVLRAFMDRPAIYASSSGARRWERNAQANLAAELSALTA